MVVSKGQPRDTAGRSQGIATLPPLRMAWDQVPWLASESDSYQRALTCQACCATEEAEEMIEAIVTRADGATDGRPTDRRVAADGERLERDPTEEEARGVTDCWWPYGAHRWQRREPLTLW